MSEKIIHVDFISGKRIKPAEAHDSYTFNRAVSMLTELGVDHPDAREALSFLSENEQIEALKSAEYYINPNAS